MKTLIFHLIFLCSCAFGFATTAKANIIVEVDGTSYELVVLDGAAWNTHSELNDPTFTPWLGNSAEALSVVNQIVADFSSLNLAAGVTQLWVGYNSSVNVHYTDGTNITQAGFWPAGQVAPGFGGTNHVAWVTTTGVPVPEIDGPILAQAGLILMALFFWFKFARRRSTTA